MRESKYLRLALMFGDNNATTFKKNLEKMISLVLHDHYEKSLTIVGIIDELRDSYGLEFSEGEILEVINGKSQNHIVCIEKSGDSSQNKYSITPNVKRTIDEKIDSSVIKDTITLFLSENQNIKVNADSFEITLKKYFYTVFNSNATTISELLNKKFVIELEDDVNFTEPEKEQINTFLEWNNITKDKCVYQMVSCCFDYCMMTVKRDKNIYQNMFRQKKFYLDTNIIFRIMGLNRENRKIIIDTFIRKCKSVGIELRYTNYTQKEINDTIDHHVNQVKELLKRNEPISVDSVRVMSSKYYNLSFYEAYVTWCDDPANLIGDYNSFATYMKRQANSILREFSYKTYDGFESTRPDDFNRYCDDLKKEKISRRGYAKDEVVQTDVNNFMYIRELNDKDQATDFASTHHYLISADHVLVDWARAIRPESVPIVVLPSVWYSLILQYTGRAEDDFASFTRFLNFSLTTQEGEEDSRKISILKKVIQLDEPREIKERTIFDIQAKLQTDYSDFDSIEEIVDNSHEFILDQERERIREEIQYEARIQINNIKESAATEINRTMEVRDREYSIEKARHAQVEFELTEKNKDLLNKVEEARKQGAKETADRLIDAELSKKIKLYWSIAILLFAVFIFITIMLVIKLVDGEIPWLPDIYGKASVFIDVIVEIIVMVGGKLIFKKCLCSLDKEIIRERLIDKYSKYYLVEKRM